MKQLSRHQFLRGTGACVSLPLLSAMQRSSCHAQETASQLPRTVMICGGLGFHAPFLFPDAPGNDYTATPYLELLKEHRRHLTVF
ncbi:MAG: hypothetical protein ACO3FE_22685, partial [Planctomycetaceae bacterium]